MTLDNFQVSSLTAEVHTQNHILKFGLWITVFCRDSPPQSVKRECGGSYLWWLRLIDWRQEAWQPHPLFRCSYFPNPSSICPPFLPYFLAARFSLLVIPPPPANKRKTRPKSWECLGLWGEVASCLEWRCGSEVSASLQFPCSQMFSDHREFP